MNHLDSKGEWPWPTLGRTTPCAGCPWLRKSARGWLGNDDPLHFYQTGVSAETPMPCHQQVDYGDPEWTTQLPNVDLCAGNLIYFNNHVKSPRRPEIAAAVKKVGTSPHVFQWPQEFLTHHMRDATEQEVHEACLRSQFPPPPED